MRLLLEPQDGFSMFGCEYGLLAELYSWLFVEPAAFCLPQLKRLPPGKNIPLRQETFLRLALGKADLLAVFIAQADAVWHKGEVDIAELASVDHVLADEDGDANSLLAGLFEPFDDVTPARTVTGSPSKERRWLLGCLILARC